MIRITGYSEDWPKRFAEIRDCLCSEMADDGVQDHDVAVEQADLDPDTYNLTFTPVTV